MDTISDRYTIDTLPDKFKTLHVLIVNDESIMRKLITKSLTKCIHGNIHSVPSAIEAIQYVNSNIINLLIVDLVMQGMNGLQLVREIRMGNTSLYKNTPIIISSALINRKILDTAIQLDINGYILKTEGMENMGKKINDALKTRITLKSSDDYYHVNTNVISI